MTLLSLVPAQPLPAGSEVCCSARLISVEGRKIWAAVQLADKPDGTIFASGKVRCLQLPRCR